MQCEFSFQSESESEGEGEGEKTSHGLLRQCCFQTIPPLVLATRLGNTLFVSFTKLDPRTSNKWMMTLLRYSYLTTWKAQVATCVQIGTWPSIGPFHCFQLKRERNGPREKEAEKKTL